MMEVRVPAGRHAVELHYWPNTFTVGIILALCSVFGLAIFLLLVWIRPRILVGSRRRSVDSSA
jgi:uncharacterized membrane protein YfhO